MDFSKILMQMSFKSTLSLKNIKNSLTNKYKLHMWQLYEQLNNSAFITFYSTKRSIHIAF